VTARGAGAGQAGGRRGAGGGGRGGGGDRRAQVWPRHRPQAGSCVCSSAVLMGCS
jgi:hypothetical protein